MKGLYLTMAAMLTGTLVVLATASKITGSDRLKRAAFRVADALDYVLFEPRGPLETTDVLGEP